MKIPIFYLEIDETTETGVEKISLVERPAVEIDFLKFSKSQRFKYEITDTDKREVFGVVMLPDVPIYRDTPHFGEHYVVFTRETIKKIAQRFFELYGAKSVNLDHSTDTDDVTIYESYIVEKERGKLPPLAFSDVTDGTWLASMKINNDELWQKIKKGEFNGFSVEGLFTYGKTLNNNNQFKKRETKNMNETRKMAYNIKRSVAKMLYRFAEAVAADGTVLMWEDETTPVVGTQISTYDANGEVIPAPAGKYVVNGMTWVIDENGKIVEIIYGDATAQQTEQPNEYNEAQQQAMSVQMMAFATVIDKMAKTIDEIAKRVDKLEKSPLANPEKHTTPPSEANRNPFSGMFKK